MCRAEIVLYASLAKSNPFHFKHCARRVVVTRTAIDLRVSTVVMALYQYTGSRVFSVLRCILLRVPLHLWCCFFQRLLVTFLLFPSHEF